MGRHKKPVFIGAASMEEPVKIVEEIKEKIYVIDDNSTEYKTLCNVYGKDYYLLRTRATKQTDTLYDIIKENLEGNKDTKQTLKFFLHYTKDDYNEDPILYDFINQIRNEYTPEQISIYKAFENHDRKTVTGMS